VAAGGAALGSGGGASEDLLHALTSSTHESRIIDLTAGHLLRKLLRIGAARGFAIKM
jgi:hypothetical protein